MMENNKYVCAYCQNEFEVEELADEIVCPFCNGINQINSELFFSLDDEEFDDSKEQKAEEELPQEINEEIDQDITIEELVSEETICEEIKENDEIYEDVNDELSSQQRLIDEYTFDLDEEDKDLVETAQCNESSNDLNESQIEEEIFDQENNCAESDEQDDECLLSNEEQIEEETTENNDVENKEALAEDNDIEEAKEVLVAEENTETELNESDNDTNINEESEEIELLVTDYQLENGEYLLENKKDLTEIDNESLAGLLAVCMIKIKNEIGYKAIVPNSSNEESNKYIDSFKQIVNFRNKTINAEWVKENISPQLDVVFDELVDLINKSEELEAELADLTIKLNEKNSNEKNTINLINNKLNLQFVDYIEAPFFVKKIVPEIKNEYVTNISKKEAVTIKLKEIENISGDGFITMTGGAYYDDEKFAHPMSGTVRLVAKVDYDNCERFIDDLKNLLSIQYEEPVIEIKEKKKGLFGLFK